MKFYAECVACLCQSALRKAERVKDPALKLEYMRQVCRVIESADPEHDAAPLVDARIIQLRRSLLGIEEDYSEGKRSFNRLLLELYPQLCQRVEAAPDPLMAALQFSMYGNYIDFGVLEEVKPEELMRLLDEAQTRSLDAGEYQRLCQDLQGEGELVFLHDNCGEVVLDKLLMQTIQARYPRLKLVSIVRGAPILNDVTMQDALEVGLNDVAQVMENGLRDIAGTQLDMLPVPVLERIRGAKLVIAKGQGNFETLIGCGLNVYYLFLSKCAGYTQWFGFEHFSGILQNELRMKH